MQKLKKKTLALPNPIMILLFTFLSWFLLALSNEGSLELAAPIAALLTAGAAVFLSVKSAKRQSILFWAVTVYTIICGISTFYAAEKVFALGEFEKVLYGYCAYLAIHFFDCDKNDKAATVCCILTGAISIFSFLSIDLISTHWFSDLYMKVFSALGAPLSGITGLEQDVRITSITLNPNAFAGLTGIAVLLSLGIIAHDTDRFRKRFAAVTLAVNALAFALTFSMGASGMLFIAYLLLLLFEKPSSRVRILIVTAETVLITILAVVPIYSTSFKNWNGFQPIPLLCTVAAAALLCFVDTAIGDKIILKSEQKKSSALPFVIGGSVLAAVLVLALTMTTKITLQKDETLRRSAYLKAGEYTAVLDADSPLQVTVTSQNMRNAINHTSETIYSGTASELQFTVPEDSIVVYFELKASETTELRTVQYSGVQSGALKLKYMLLPGFIANRLQGLFANQNAIQRFIFFRDGLRVFSRHPIRGSGLGSFENAIFGVADFYYETKYIHNHYIQMLADTGIIGFISFTAILICGFVVLRKKRISDAPFLSPALTAVLAFTALHALIELTFSDFFFIPISYAVFAVIDCTCAENFPACRKTTAYPIWATRITALLMIIYAFMIFGYRQAKAEIKQLNYTTLESAIDMDHFGWEENAITYVFNVANDTDAPAARIKKSEGYLKRLEKSEASGTPLYLARIYFTRNEPEKAFEHLKAYTERSSAFPLCWNLAFDLIREHYQETDTFRRGCLELYELMLCRPSAEMNGNPLSDENKALIQYLQEN